MAIVRRGAEVAMVRQSAPEGDYWVLPGGLAEPGELIPEALVRETREEAGIVVEELGPLALLSHIDRPDRGMQVVTAVFEVARWSGALAPADPDGEVLEA